VAVKQFKEKTVKEKDFEARFLIIFFACSSGTPYSIVMPLQESTYQMDQQDEQMLPILLALLIEGGVFDDDDDDDGENENDDDAMELVAMIMGLLEAVDDAETRLVSLLFPDWIPLEIPGKDVHRTLLQHPHHFWYLVGETPDSFMDLVHLIAADVIQPRNVRLQYNPDEPREPRPTKLIIGKDFPSLTKQSIEEIFKRSDFFLRDWLKFPKGLALSAVPQHRLKRFARQFLVIAYLGNVVNRILLVMIWYRQSPSLHLLANRFGVSPTTVCDEIHHITPILRFHLQHEVQWFSDLECQQLQGSWPEIPSAIGALDCTIHRTSKPVENQGEMFRGDKHCHFFSTFGVVDPFGYFREIDAGFKGHLNDTQQYWLSELGSGLKPLGHGARFLADGGFPAVEPLLVPYPADVAGNDPAMLGANAILRRYRVLVERAFKNLKTSWVLKKVWLGDKGRQAEVVQVCAYLHNRKRRMILNQIWVRI